MNAITRVASSMTRDEFLAWDGHARGRYEFDGKQPIAMTGGSPRHGRIISQLILTVFSAVDRSAWAMMTDAGVAVPGGGVRYPDALIAPCAGIGDGPLVESPVIVFEVLSPSTSGVDRTIKAREYQGIPSIQRFVLVEQEVAAIQVLHRAANGQDWLTEIVLAGETLALPEIRVTVPVDAIYTSLSFASPDPVAAKGT